jgi:hypothetical protein
LLNKHYLYFELDKIALPIWRYNFGGNAVIAFKNKTLRGMEIVANVLFRGHGSRAIGTMAGAHQ